MRPVLPFGNDRHNDHRTGGETIVSNLAADFRTGIRPVSLAWRDRGTAQPATHDTEQRPRAGCRDRRGHRLNAALYPDDDRIAELLTEPDAAMRRKLARRLPRRGREARIVDAPAERLPFPDASVDTVVSTLVLCTVPDPERTLREIARVLRADGQLLFIEHVRAKSRFLAACQDYLFLPWRRFAAGCCCNRPTAELMRACGFEVAADDFVWRGMPAIVRPLVVGRASR